MLPHDFDLQPSHLQSLSSRDAIVALFAQLGYNTEARLTQTTAAMGFPAALAHEVTRIECIADHEQGTLQVYLIEMKRVAVALTQALARTLRNRGGSFLLVLTADFDMIRIVNMFPDEGLERLLGLVESLSRKIADIDATGFLDDGVPGETVHPRNFNTLRRIRDEDGTVVEEQEQFVELASSEFMLQQLKSLLASGAQERLDALPDGIHSGLHKSGNRALFFYFTAPDAQRNTQHFWRYYDLQTDRILDNRFLIANLIACAPDTPRVIGEADVFAIQAKVQQHTLDSLQAQAAAEAAPTIIEPIQQTVAAVLREHLNNPGLKRSEVRAALRVLSQPMIRTALRQLKTAYEAYTTNGDVAELLATVRRSEPINVSREPPPTPAISIDDLHLVCWEYLWS